MSKTNNMSEKEKIIKFHPAYDRKDEGYGVRGVDLEMVLKGDLGAVQFILYTNWYLDIVRKDAKPLEPVQRPLPAYLRYHSPMPQYEGQEVSTEDCAYLNDKPCYCDGSTLEASRIFKVLVESGSDGVWSALEDYYKETFEL